MKYKVWYTKYLNFIVEADSEEDAECYADGQLERYCARHGECSSDYELDECTEVKDSNE